VLKANPVVEPIVRIKSNPKDSQPMPTVIVSRPGIMQQSLRASLAACRGIDVVATSGDGLTALRQVALNHPDMLVIDSNLLDEEVEALIASVKVEQPTIDCLVVVRSSRQETRMLALGADAAMLRDVSPQQFQTELARLVSRRSSTDLK
jgi:DNA-binding NarL/FixJ family response regulator